MKICFIYYSVFRYGGVQRIMANLLNYLSDFYDIEIIVIEKPDLNKNIYNLNLDRISVRYLELDNSKYLSYKIKKKVLKKIILANKNIQNKFINSMCTSLYYSKVDKEKFIKFINDNNYDVVIGCSMQINLLLGIINRKLNCKTVAWEHNSLDNYFNNVYKNMEYFCGDILRNLDSRVCLTNIDSEKYKKLLNLDTIVIPNMLGFKVENKSKLEDKVILSVGRIESAKGTDLLIEIFKEFNKKNYAWKLVILGEGELEEYIVNKIKEYKLERAVKIIPFTQNVMMYYQEASIYACTSRYESFGLSIIEAMEAGLPVVSFNSVGPSELIKSNEYGILIEKYNIEEFSNTLDLLANNNEILKSFSIKSVEKAKEFSIYKIGGEWIRLLENLVV